MESASSPSTVKFSDVLRLLRGPSDEERMAGLLLFTKVAKTEQLDDLRQAFDALGTAFLRRLLKTKGGASHVITPYQRLALSMFATFCAIPELPQHSDLPEIIALVLSTLEPSSNAPDDCDSSSGVEDSLRALLALTRSSAGCRLVYLCDALPVIVRFLLGFRLPPSSTQSIALLFSVMSLLGALCTVRATLPAANAHRDSILQSVQWLAPLMASENVAELRFSAMETLTCILGVCTDEDVRLWRRLMGVKQVSGWLSASQTGIALFISSRLGVAQRDSALLLAATLLTRFGESWAAGGVSHPALSKKLGPGKFVQMLLSLVSIEIRLVLEGHRGERVAHQPVDPGAHTTEEGTAMPFALESANAPSVSTILGVCFDVLEQALHIMCRDDDDEEDEGPLRWTNFGHEVLLGIRSTLIQTYRSILEYLDLVGVREEATRLHADTSGEEFKAVLPAEPHVLRSCCRCLGGYLAQDLDALVDDLIVALPHLVPLLLPHNSRSPASSTPDTDNVWAECLEFLLPALLLLTEPFEGGDQGPSEFVSSFDMRGRIEAILKAGVHRSIASYIQYQCGRRQASTSSARQTGHTRALRMDDDRLLMALGALLNILSGMDAGAQHIHPSKAEVDLVCQRAAEVQLPSTSASDIQWRADVDSFDVETVKDDTVLLSLVPELCAVVILPSKKAGQDVDGLVVKASSRVVAILLHWRGVS